MSLNVLIAKCVFVCVFFFTRVRLYQEEDSKPKVQKKKEVRVYPEPEKDDPLSVLSSIIAQVTQSMLVQPNGTRAPRATSSVGPVTVSDLNVVLFPSWPVGGEQERVAGPAGPETDGQDRFFLEQEVQETPRPNRQGRT